MPKVHFGSRGGAYVMKAGKKVYLNTRFGGSNEDFFPDWFNDDRADLLRRGPPGVRTDYALVSMPINENEIRGPGEPSAYELEQQKYYAENQVFQYESSMKAIFNKALRTFNRNSTGATPEQITLGDIPNPTDNDYTRSPINIPATHRFQGGPRSWASHAIGTRADQIRIFKNAYNYIRETTRVLAAMDTGLQFGKRKNKFGVDSVFASPAEAYYAMLDKALYYQRELDKCQGSLLSRGSSPASWDGPISISRQSSLNSGESTPRILRGVDPRYLKRP